MSLTLFSTGLLSLSTSLALAELANGAMPRSLSAGKIGPGFYELGHDSFPHKGTGVKDPREASLHEVVGVFEKNSEVTVLHDIGAWAKPCVSPVWEAEDPICGNGRKVAVNAGNGNDSILLWLVPPGEACQVRCPSDRWYLQPNVDELKCGSVLLDDVPDDGVTCSCCLWHIEAIMLMLPLALILPCFFFDFRRRCADRDAKIEARIQEEKNAPAQTGQETDAPAAIAPAADAPAS